MHRGRDAHEDAFIGMRIEPSIPEEVDEACGPCRVSWRWRREVATDCLPLLVDHLNLEGGDAGRVTGSRQRPEDSTEVAAEIDLGQPQRDVVSEIDDDRIGGRERCAGERDI